LETLPLRIGSENGGIAATATEPRLA